MDIDVTEQPIAGHDRLQKLELLVDLDDLRFLNADVRALELRPAKDIAAADHQADLAAAIGRLLDLAGDLRHLLHADPALAGMAEAFAGEL
jgi:hypothetical protein